MSLPGKLCVGILEEDNPLRSYFRFKPLLVEENGRYIPFEDYDLFPDDGCIRIVPDKNEAYYFKSRMRQNGLFSVVDLRNHPNENDKIRPNKNYRPGGEESNANIIYSDVVRTPARGMIYQMLSPEALKAPIPAPHTREVLIRQDNGINPICHTWEAEAAGPAGRLRATGDSVTVGDFQAFDVPGFRGEQLSFLIKPAALMAEVCDTPDASAHLHSAPQPAHEKAEEEPPQPKPPVQPEAKPVPRAAEVPPKPEGKAEARPEAKPEPAGEKPWIHHEPPAPDPQPRHPISRVEQIKQSQVGLNPRRGRSLQELIDEKWQYSRMNQLGLPVAPVSTGTPVKNPVDSAVDAVRRAWDNPQTRSQLVEALAKVDDFDEMVKRRREQAIQSDVNEHLNALEAQRLELLSDIDHLKLTNAHIREQLKQEIRQNEADAFAEAVEKTHAAQSEQQKYEQLASDARMAAADARGLLDRLRDDELEVRIRDVALTRRVQERLDLLKEAGEGPATAAAPQSIDMDAFIQRVMKRAQAEGFKCSRLEAANLCVCLALSPVMLISGAPGSGKTAAARILAEAMGTPASGRHFVCPPGPRPLTEDRRLKRLFDDPETTATVLIDDANLTPTRDVLRGMGQCRSPQWRIIATVQDAHSGAPLNAHLLDQGFVVRMTVPEDLPWQPAPRRALLPEELMAIEALRQTLPETQVPERIVERMERLRKWLAAHGALVSRRALNDTWHYCAAMLAIMGEAADADDLFDRAVAQRLLLPLLASAPLDTARRMQSMLSGLPRCVSLLQAPMPVNIE